ncbi:agrin-like [Littorina saxatilis]|uniref:Kazal-like domain-containing protein n=1 Tax=Littorina saxatilis TaxID=31220 RepID=A0AAN9GDZ3_9CAEN
MAFSLWITRWVVVLFMASLLSSLSSTRAMSIKCDVCVESRCPELHYCEGEPVKDHCGCCTVCSSSRYQPHPLITNNEREGSACAQVKCPKFKVCMENVQSLPLCTCPSTYICRTRKRARPVCGSDDVTYESRCYLRIAACNSATRIKVAKKGPCDGDEGSRPPVCESFSTCRRRKNQRPVCGTDGKTYISRCHMKIMACQDAVKIKLKNPGVCQTAPTHPGSVTALQDSVRSDGVNNDAASHVSRAKKRKGRRKRKKTSGSDVVESEEEKERRRQRRREKRKKRKERRRKRRKTGKRRSRRFKIDRNRFRRTFDHIKQWKY